MSRSHAGTGTTSRPARLHRRPAPSCPSRPSVRIMCLQREHDLPKVAPCHGDTPIQTWTHPDHKPQRLNDKLSGAEFILRSKSSDLVPQELFGFLTVYQALCSLRAEAAQRAGIDPDRISFTVTVRVARTEVTNQAAATPPPWTGPAPWPSITSSQTCYHHGEPGNTNGSGKHPRATTRSRNTTTSASPARSNTRSK
jgi:hypothetical protein